MKSAFLSRNFEHFKNIFPGAGQFYNLMQVTDEGIILIDNRIAVPESLRSAVLNHLRRNQPGQLVMIDVAGYLWWPKLHRAILHRAENCDRSTEYGKILKVF